MPSCSIAFSYAFLIFLLSLSSSKTFRCSFSDKLRKLAEVISLAVTLLSFKDLSSLFNIFLTDLSVVFFKSNLICCCLSKLAISANLSSLLAITLFTIALALDAAFTPPKLEFITSVLKATCLAFSNIDLS